MNLCMTVSTFLAAIILLRILFLMKEIAEIGYYAMADDDVSAPTHLRGFHTYMLAYDKFEKIHKQVLMIAATGGHDHQYNLCYKDPDVSKTIEAMMMQAFPDSAVKTSNNGTCTMHKISW